MGLSQLAEKNAGDLRPAGGVQLRLVKANRQPVGAVREPPLRDILRFGFPKRGLPDEVNRWRSANWPHLWRGMKNVLAARMLGIPTHYGQLHLVRQRPLIADRLLPELLQEWAEKIFPFPDFPTWCKQKGFGLEQMSFGLASLRMVTDTGVAFIVDAFQNILELEIMKYHAIGTGGAAEAVGNTALTTECTTAYNPDNTRATGSLTEGASANIFRTVGTNTVDAAVANTEHGILSQAAVGGGVLLDRSLYSVVNLANGDSLQSTYDLTNTAGG
jgi:hypothetical protein